MPRNLHSLLDQLIEQFAEAVVARAQVKSGGRGRTSLVGARICPVPGCGKPGAGPRNRWFCRDHSRTIPVAEQKKMLVAAREKAAELRRSERQNGKRGGGRRLNMVCRVEGCKNLSRGPRFGYICDKHRKELSAREQQQARDKWNEAHNKKAA